jgi:CRP/FNR family transcriptional regulator
MCIAGGNVVDIAKTSRAPAGFTEMQRQPLRNLGGHDHLYFEGDARTHILVVANGWVKLYRTLVDGQRQVVGFANAGSILGLESDGVHVNACEAITPVSVRAIPVGRISELCAADGMFAEQILRQIGRQLGASQTQLATVGAQTSEQKLATFLLSICRLNGKGGCDEFDMPMRRGDVAEFLGLRLETVSRKITEFQRRGWIKMASLYHCRITNRAVLEELAQGASLENL